MKLSEHLLLLLFLLILLVLDFLLSDVDVLLELVEQFRELDFKVLILLRELDQLVHQLLLFVADHVQLLLD